MEQWLAIAGFEGRYEVSDLGQVRSLGRTETITRRLNNGRIGRVTRTKKTRVLAPSRGSNGYLTVRLLGKTYTVHRLVLSAFEGPCPGGYAGCHADGDRSNNRRSNLRWDSYAANNAERLRHGMVPLQKGADGRFLRQRGAEA